MKLKDLICQYPVLFMSHGVLKIYLQVLSSMIYVGKVDVGLVRPDMAIAIIDDDLHKTIDLYEKQLQPIKYDLSFDVKWDKDGNKLSLDWDVSSRNVFRTGYIEDGHRMLIISKPYDSLCGSKENR